MLWVNNNFPRSTSSQIFCSQIILTHCLIMCIFLFACHGIWIWPSCVHREDQKLQSQILPMVRLCWSEHPDWTVLQLHFAEHAIFLKLCFTYHTAPLGRTPRKVSCWSSNNSLNLLSQQIQMILYKRTHTKFYDFYILGLCLNSHANCAHSK